MEAKKLALLCRDLADNRKAENILVLDVRELSSVTDYFVVASGTSEPHLRAISSELLDRLLEDHDIRPIATDGSETGGWLVMDFFDVIVHIMRPEQRAHYDLEGLWNDAPRVVKAARKKAVRKKSAATPPSPAE